MSIPQGKVLATLQVKKVLVTPQLAKSYKEHSNPNNRPLNPSSVIAYAMDMKSGLWDEDAIEPVVFDINETMRNGHHRIDGVIESNVAVPLWIIENAPVSDTYDLQYGRTYNAILKMKGIQVSNQATALIRKIGDICFGVKKVSVGEVEKAYIADGFDINAICNASTRGCGAALSICRKASVTAAMYCAYKSGVPMNILAEFAEIANSGIPHSIDQTAPITFRNQIIKNGRVYHSNGGSRDLFRIAQEAIYHFVNNRQRQKSFKGKCIYEATFKREFLSGKLFEEEV